MMHTITDADCLHVKWCRGKRRGPHESTCPRNVLKLSDAEVDAFCALFVEKHPVPKNMLKKYIVGRYNGLVARCTLSGDPDEERESARWLVENLMMVAKERGL